LTSSAQKGGGKTRDESTPGVLKGGPWGMSVKHRVRIDVGLGQIIAGKGKEQSTQGKGEKKGVMWRVVLG